MGQVRWGRRVAGGQVTWRPIPEDRDWALTRIDGLGGALSRWLMPKYVGFGDRFPPIERLAEAGARVWRVIIQRGGRQISAVFGG